jgi:hypothetical protein
MCAKLMSGVGLVRINSAENKEKGTDLFFTTLKKLMELGVDYAQDGSYCIGKGGGFIFINARNGPIVGK